VDTLSGSETAKERLKVILETLAGTCRVQEACVRLGISEPRFHQLRTQILQAALTGSELRAPGRKPHILSPAQEQVRLLEQKLEQQDAELRLARVREEVALTLPRVSAAVVSADPDVDPAKKKRDRRLS
jgi:hypothetical protein